MGRFLMQWFTPPIVTVCDTMSNSFKSYDTKERIGSFTYSHAVGKYKIDDDKPIPEDAVFKLASQTKLLASISALQVVEKGLIGLDDDLANKVPELAAQPVVTGFDDKDEPILVKRKNTLTLR